VHKILKSQLYCILCFPSYQQMYQQNTRLFHGDPRRRGDPIGGGPGPPHELVDRRAGPKVDELGEDVGEVGLRIDIVELEGLDQRRDAGSTLRPHVVAGRRARSCD
jgi:hypothetical protein